MELHAVEYIRPMRGESQPHLLRCSDGHYYVVKFQNNPQGVKVLANEFVAARLANELGLPIPPFAAIRVSESLIKYSDLMVVRNGARLVPCEPGLCFGSRYIQAQEELDGSSVDSCCGDLTDSELRMVANLSDFVGMLVFDKWTSNIDYRQVIFSRRNWREPYRVSMIDNGYCFGGTDWEFRDAPVLGLYKRRIVYQEVKGLSAFEPWLFRLNRSVKRDVLKTIQSEVPHEWYGDDAGAIDHLIEELDQKRVRLRELLWETLRVKNTFFPTFTMRPSVSRRDESDRCSIHSTD